MHRLCYSSGSQMTTSCLETCLVPKQLCEIFGGWSGIFFFLNILIVYWHLSQNCHVTCKPPPCDLPVLLLPACVLIVCCVFYFYLVWQLERLLCSCCKQVKCICGGGNSHSPVTPAPMMAQPRRGPFYIWFKSFVCTYYKHSGGVGQVTN